MTRDELLALMLAERYGPLAPVEPSPADDELTTARRRRDLNAALDDAPPDYRRGIDTQEAL